MAKAHKPHFIAGVNTENSTGFQMSGYIDKQGTPSGESAKFNFLPPGQWIEDQENAAISELPMKKLLPLGYGDGFKE